MSNIQNTENDNATSGLFGWLIRKWWTMPLIVLALFLMVTLLLNWLGDTPATWLAYRITLALSAMAILFLIGVAVSAFVHKQIGQGCTILVADLMLMAFVLVGSFVLSMADASAPEHFADKHPIPQGMKLSDPLKIEIEYPYRDTSYTAHLVDSNDPGTWLQLNGQYGEYGYDLYYPPLSDGWVFLRCYEATSGLPLSEDHIPQRTETSVRGHTSFGQVANMRQNSFMLYEGDFDEYYAVRVEAWHRDSLSGAETKLLEKPYRLDGWMR